MILNMNNCWGYILQILITLVVGILIWKIFYSFLYQNYKNIFSVIVTNLFLLNVQKAHNLVTTLSGGAILLTFTVLQVFRSKIPVDYSFLIFAWAEFSLSVITGILIFIVISIYSTIQRTRRNIMVKLLKKEKMNNDDQPKQKNVFDLFFQKEKKFGKRLIIFSFAQYYLFVLAVINFFFFLITSL